MNLLRRSLSRPVRRRISLALATLVFPFGGCSLTSPTKFGASAKIVRQDATSPAGRKLLADLTRAALNVGLDIASDNDTGATVAGIQGAANTLRDYEGLPGATVARAAAAGSGMADVATVLAPSVEALVDNARQTASRQKVNIDTDDLLEAVARGFDAVADARRVPTVR